MVLNGYLRCGTMAAGLPAREERVGTICRSGGFGKTHNPASGADRPVPVAGVAGSQRPAAR